MSVFILDTDTLSFLQHDHPVVLAAVDSAMAGGHTVGLTAVTVEEQVKGWFAAFQRARNNAQRARASAGLAEVVPLWATFPILPQSEASLNRFDALVRMKLNVGKMDLRVASIALEVGATVVTHNLRDFGRVPGLPIVDWTVPPPAPTSSTP